MSTPCTLSVFPKCKNSQTFWKYQRNIMDSPYSKILHDPECQSQCCSIFGQSSDNDINNLEQYSYFTTRQSEEVFNTVTNENQFSYDMNHSSNQVPEFQEHLENNEHLQSDYEKLLKRITYDSCSMKISSTETRYKQRNNCKGITKRKRKRTIFSTEQIVIMEGVFKKRPYVSTEERLLLSQRLQISEKAIKIWFQNRRRVTEKTDKEQSDSYHSDSTGEEACNSYNTRLDYIEAQIIQNTDEYGFVTLDSKTLTDLVKLIDDVLSHNVNCYNPLLEVNTNDGYLMYESMSPESLCEGSTECENILKWQPSKPEESLQRLIDIQTVLYS